MLDKIAGLVRRRDQLAESLNDPEVIADQALWQKWMKEYHSL